ncbi:hypothetical protein N5C72_07815 [Achromobacter mucicolens]|uniref:Uncharacterized protein n=1 Tax=Achromobacter mucicolens TaxID=1389922 RepID=A0ABD4YRA6_9BURK|nr:hypothetical protein [Achromobacter mucicolens]MDH1177977.1 hypothetical protein [Achromobacter mucicolens]
MPSPTFILTMPKGHVSPGPSKADCQALAASFDPAIASRDKQVEYAACVPVLYPKPSAPTSPADSPGLQAVAVLFILGFVVLLAVLALEK